MRNRRVELNAMTNRQLIDFVEARFAEHRVTKLIPDQNVIEQHARRTIEPRLLAPAVAIASDEIAGAIAEFW